MPALGPLFTTSLKLKQLFSNAIFTTDFKIWRYAFVTLKGIKA